MKILSGSNQVYFLSDKKELFVESGGTRAKIVDIKVASNGVIMAIDNIFGLGNQFIQKKLENKLFAG